VGEEVASGLIEEAIASVKAELVKVRTRTRLAGTKVKDILDDLDHLSAYLDEQKGLQPTTDLMNSILSYISKIKPYVSAIRQVVSQLESISDKLEELIP
jgi:hypothetical protein